MRALTQATNYIAMTLMSFQFTCCNKSLPFYDIYISITKQMRALENGECVFAVTNFTIFAVKKSQHGAKCQCALPKCFIILHVL